MTVADALQEWKHLADTAVHLNSVRAQVVELESTYHSARNEFEHRLEDLEEPEKAAILDIMSVYESQSPTVSTSSNNSTDEKTVNWLLNKVGNEGTNGIRVSELTELWEEQFPNQPTAQVFGVVNSSSNLFARRNNEQGDNVLFLTTEGQARFLNK